MDYVSKDQPPIFDESARNSLRAGPSSISMIIHLSLNRWEMKECSKVIGFVTISVDKVGKSLIKNQLVAARGETKQNWEGENGKCFLKSLQACRNTAVFWYILINCICVYGTIKNDLMDVDFHSIFSTTLYLAATLFSVGIGRTNRNKHQLDVH